MIRGESHDPVYTQTPNGLSGALAAEAKDMDTLESHPGIPSASRDSHNSMAGQAGFTIPSHFVPNPKTFPMKKWQFGNPSYTPKLFGVLQTSIFLQLEEVKATSSISLDWVEVFP